MFRHNLIVRRGSTGTYHHSMIQIRMSVADLGRMRFVHSPLAEVAASLYRLASGQVPAVHRPWFRAVRDDLGRLDLSLLNAVVPARPYIATFLCSGAADRSTTIERQLDVVATLPVEELTTEMMAVWRGHPMPTVLRETLANGQDAARRLADEMWRYWSVAIEPYWAGMRAVLEDDVTFRAGELTRVGITGMFEELHRDVSVDGDLLQINKKPPSRRRHLGVGLVLVPGIFVSPDIVVGMNSVGPVRLNYGARGVGNLWGADVRPADSDSLVSLVGRSRAAILVCLATPQSTTELALRLGQSPPSVSQHLSVLRRSGLATSWRRGRFVLYRRTDLGTSVLEASGSALDVPALAATTEVGRHAANA